MLLFTQYDRIMSSLFGDTVQDGGQKAVMSAEDAAFTISFGIVLILFLLIMIYGSNIANSIVEEKSARIIETLLCYVKPLQLLSGKILGYVSGIATQMMKWVICYFIINITIGFPENSILEVFKVVDSKIFVLILASIVLGFIMYAFSFAALAPFADNAQDSTQLMMPMVLFMLMAYFISIGILNGTKGTWTEVVSYLPFFSPIVSLVTINLNHITWVEILVKVGAQFAEVLVLAVVCSKIYKRGVIQYGFKKFSFNRGRKKEKDSYCYRSEQ